MIKGVKVIERIGENKQIVHFRYKDYESWWLAEEFDNMTKEVLDNVVEESRNKAKQWDEVKKRIESQRAAMTSEERAGWDEADRAVFERWQDEANTNAILDGYMPEDGEDTDFNPFRKKG